MATENMDINNRQKVPTTTTPVGSTTTTTTTTNPAPSVTSSNLSGPTEVSATSYTPTGIYDPNNVQQYNQEREANLRNLYDTAQQNTLASLKTAYEQNMSDAEAAKNQIAPQYQESANALAAEYERQRRNNNMQAAANGLNTGAGSQMALGQSMAYQKNQGVLSRAENQALDEANRAIADLQRNYQNAIAENAANNNYQMAAALLDEYENAYNRQLQINNLNYERALQAENTAYNRAFNEDERDYTRAYNEENRDYTRSFNEDQRDYARRMDEAANKASFGDFSGYENIYGKDIADVMKLTWTLQNPEIAWASGNLKAEDYYALTGHAPSNPANGYSGATGYYSGLSTPSGGGYGGGYRSGALRIYGGSNGGYYGGGYSGGGYYGGGSSGGGYYGGSGTGAGTATSGYDPNSKIDANVVYPTRSTSSTAGSAPAFTVSYGNIGNNKLSLTGGAQR